MTLPLKVAQQILAQQPFSQLPGAELTRFDEIAEIQLPMKPELQQQNGFAHGGVISYLADNALTFAGGLALGANILTAEFKVNYLKPAQGDRLIARAEVVSSGKRQAVCRCDVVVTDDDSDDERLCATALGTIVSTGHAAG